MTPDFQVGRIKLLLILCLFVLSVYGCNDSSSSRSGTGNGSPQIPVGLAASSLSPTSVKLDWQASSGGNSVSKYRILRNGAPVATVSNTTWTDITASPSTKFCYRIIAVDSAGKESGPSDDACADTPPSVPSNLSVVPVSSAVMTISWTASTDNRGVVAYKIYKNGVPVASVETTSWSDTGLSASTNYCYSVSAVDLANNESVKSDQACAITKPDTQPPPADTAAPTVPSNVVAAADSSTSATLTWSASADNVGVTGYRIYRDSVLKTTVNSLTWTETGLTASTAYCYKISAIDAAGNESLKSDEKCVTTQAAIVLCKLNDTGINWWSDNSSNNLIGPLAGFPGQDADYGRDKTNNDDSDGHAGSSFTKIDSAGNVLPVVAANWSAVLDNVTGLMWENKTAAAGLHCKDNIYSWYEPDNTKNGGNAGTQNGGICSEGHCDTWHFVQAVNAENFCGHSDWRMPTKKELHSIVNYGSVNPAIDTMFFSNTGYSWYSYWSSLPLADDGRLAWGVEVGGGDDQYGKDRSYNVRLVRGGV